MTREIAIRSSRDGVTLTLSNFAPEDPSHVSESFLVEVKAYDVRAEIRASTYMAPDLGQFFASLARDWRGWRGERKWGTLENEFELVATADTVGHVRLGYAIRPPFTDLHWELRGALELEAGGLEAIAAEVASVWRNSA